MKETYKEILMTLLRKWDANGILGMKVKMKVKPSEVSTHKPKSAWNTLEGSPALELFLSKVIEDIFSVLPGHPKKFNLNKTEYPTMRSL